MKKKTKKALSIATAVVMISSCMSGCHIHNYSKATCTEAAVCKSCGEIKQEALGHTTSFGWCSNCESHVNSDLFAQIVTIYGEISWDSELAEEIRSTSRQHSRIVSIGEELWYNSYEDTLEDLIIAWEEPRNKFFELFDLLRENEEVVYSSPELYDFFEELLNFMDLMPSSGCSVEYPQNILAVTGMIYNCNTGSGTYGDESCQAKRLENSFNELSNFWYNSEDE